MNERSSPAGLPLTGRPRVQSACERDSGVTGSTRGAWSGWT